MLIDPVIRALADSTRLRVLRLLARMELAVGELALVLGQSQPRVSRHIRILCDAGLAARRREGAWVFVHCALSASGGAASAVPVAGGAGAGIAGAVASLLNAAENEDRQFAAQCAADRRRLAAIRAARESAAAEYFAAHADEWDRLRSLHSADAEVEAMLSRAVGRGGLGALLDIGTGTGRMAELFAPRARHVTGLDKSPDMLRIARARLQTLPADRFELVQGDFAAMPLPDSAFDTVLLHQVLHYAQAPGQVLAEAARVTRPGGRIVIADYAAHDREELRLLHAHARLGFAEDQLIQALADAGFEPGEVRSVPGSELTVTIWTGTRRDDSLARNTHDNRTQPAKAARI